MRIDTKWIAPLAALALLSSTPCGSREVHDAQGNPPSSGAASSTAAADAADKAKSDAKVDANANAQGGRDQEGPSIDAVLPMRKSVLAGFAALDGSTEAHELGSTASSAELCGMDPPSQIARQAGVQLSALLWTRSGPEQARADLLAFAQGYSAHRAGYLAMDEIRRSESCAFGWLQWRSMRTASELSSTRADFKESASLAYDTGSIHGWAWACQANAQDALQKGPQLARQTAAVMLFSTLASNNPADLLEAQKGWLSAFDLAYFDPKLNESDCRDIQMTLPTLASSFEGKMRLAPSLLGARAARLRLSGRPS